MSSTESIHLGLTVIDVDQWQQQRAQEKLRLTVNEHEASFWMKKMLQTKN